MPSATAMQPKEVGAPENLLAMTVVAELLTSLSFDPSLPTFLNAVFIGSCLSLPSMLAAWSCIRSGAWRYCLAVFLTLVNGYVLTWVVRGWPDWLFILLPLATTLPTLLTLSLIKRFFGRFAPLVSGADFFGEGLRFNLSHLFIVTTSLAVLLVIGKVIWPFLEYNSLPIELLVFGSLVVLISFNTLLHVWALMGNKSSCALALRSRWGLLRW